MTSDHYTVSKSAKADHDLRTLADYVARGRSLDDAVALVDAARGKIEALEQFPKRGSVPEKGRAFGETDFRQVFVGRYRILHLVENNKVTITMVADGSRDIFALPKRRLTSG